jgi:tetratricopeptide (TPR) repeat protein
MSVVAKYLTKPQLQSGKIGFIYRGQSNADWGLTSTYYRRFNFSKSNDKSHNPTQKQFQDYHKDLISDAKSYHYHKKELNDLELLLELQHYGAATGFVDFSRDFLIALWFASHGNQNTGGKVFLLDTNSIDKFSGLQEGEEIFAKCDKLQFVSNNFKSNNRIFSQKGVFVFGNQTIDDVKTIEILQEDKQPILQEPSNIFSIDEKSLFQDIHGFSMVNDVNHPIYEKTAEEYIEKGNNNYHKSEFEKAIEAYKKAIEINPDSDMAYSNMGSAYAGLKKFEEAIEACKKAIEIDPDSDGAHHNIGLAYYNLGKFERAIEAYKKAIEIKPDSYMAYCNMGLAYDKLGELKEAIKAHKKAIEFNSNIDKAYCGMGHAYASLDKLKEAIEAYKKAIEIKPDSDMAYCNMGSAYGKSGKFKEAIEAFKKAIEFNSNIDKAYCGIGLSYDKLGEFKEAIEAFKKAIEFNSNNDNAYYNNMGLVYLKLSGFKEAIEAFKKVIQFNSNSDVAYDGMGLAYLKLGKFKEAMEAYKKAIDLNPALIHSKQQNWHPLETWINNLTDDDKKQQYLHTLKRLKDE